MNNRAYEGTGTVQSVPVSAPASPVSDNPCRIGSMTGVAASNMGVNGNPSNLTSVDLGNGVYNLAVNGVNDSGNVTINIGDPVFLVDADLPNLSAKKSGLFFGYALAAVSSGATGTVIPVLHHLKSGSERNYRQIAVTTNGTTPVNVFGALNGGTAPMGLTVTAVQVIADDTTGGNITLVDGANTIATVAKGVTAGAVLGATSLANTTVAQGDTLTVQSSSAGNATVLITFVS